MTNATRRRLVPWVTYLLTLASAWPLGEMVARAHPPQPGACSGIGFGCSLYGWDLAAFALMIVGIPYAAVLLVLLGLLSFLPDRFTWVATTVALVGLAIPWVLVVGEAAASS